MRTGFLGALTLTGMLAAGAAFAAESTMPGPATPTSPTTEKSEAATMSHSGVVKAFDAKTRMLSLKDGSHFVLGENLKGEDLKANEKVSLNYKTEGKTKTVTEYKIEPKS